MKNHIISTVAAVFMLTGSVAMAHECTELSEQVMSKIEAMSNGDPDILVPAQAMHDEAMALHEDGDHDGAVEKLNSAMKLLARGQ